MANEDSRQIAENRRAKRILAPGGTSALFMSSGGSIERARVRDISVIGLLLCDYRTTEKYLLNTPIYNIFVNIPRSELSTGSEICFLIDKGKIVRSFFDQSSGTVCYGIELSYESSYVKDQIEHLVKNA